MAEPEVVVQAEPTAMSDAELEKALSPEQPAPGDKPATEETAPTTVAAPPETPAEPAAAESTQPAPEPEDRLTALEKRLRDQEQFIQRQAAEIGRLRKTAPTVDVEKIKSEIKDRFFEDPVQASRDIQRLEQAEFEQKRGSVNQTIPGFDTMIEEMAEVAAEEGAEPFVVDAFKRDPYRPPVDILFQLASKAIAKKAEKAKQAEISKIQLEVEAQKKRTEEILKRIDEAAKGGSVLNAKSGGDSGEKGIKDLNPENIAELTDAQIEELLKRQ